MPEAHEAPASDPPRSTPTWVSTTYFAEGLPYMMVRYLAGVYLTDVGVKELYLGFLNFLALPWNFKWAWAPALDLFGTKRGWLLKVEALLVLVIALMGLCVLGGPAVVHGGATALTSATAVASLAVRLLVVVLVVAAFLAATHDIAIDSFYMEAITDPGEQAKYTGLRVMTYRMAVIFTRSVLVATAGWLSWSWSFLGAAITLGLLLAFHYVYLPRFERPRAAQDGPGGVLRQYGRAFVSYLDQPKIGLVLLFLITYKLGDEILFSMHTPFLLRGLGVSKIDLAWMQGLLGTGAGIVGALVSAWAVRRFGLRRAVWPLTLGMNLNIWVYVWLAWTRPDPKLASGLATIAAILAYEQFAAGLGNAVLMIYAMRTCKPEFKAAHYAVASAIWSIFGTICGGFGGAIVERVGYLWLFVLSFVAALPSMVCLFFLPLRDEPRSPAPAAGG
ncbi:MAG: MFS transporter [Deltaproteobacteria bacterium]|nr:MFS transporter [Deltaproteobacteria bacterium]